MTIYEKIKAMSEDELVLFLDKYCSTDDAPWMTHFSKNYCDKCKPEYIVYPFGPRAGLPQEAGYCEVSDHKQCRFFDHYPSIEEIIKLWLDSTTD